MNTKTITIPTDKITDWESFHDVFTETFGFPGFYGRNMNAWIDCMGYLDDPESGMSEVTIAVDGLVIIKLDDTCSFKKRCPEQFEVLIDCAAFVNYRRVEAGGAPILAIVFVGNL